MGPFRASQLAFARAGARRLAIALTLAVAAIAWGQAAWGQATPSKSAAGDAAAEDRKVFDHFFGPALREVQRTSDSRDDLALVRQLLDSAKASADAPGMAKLCADEAYRIALAQQDFPAALEAARVLAGLAGDASAAWNKVFDAALRWTSAAQGQTRVPAAAALAQSTMEGVESMLRAGQLEDALALLQTAQQVDASYSDAAKAEMKDRVDEIERRVKARVLLQRAKARLDNEDDKGAPAEVARLCVIELDDPAQAEPVLPRLEDKAWQLPIKAARSLDLLADADLRSLGDWYLNLSKTGPTLPIRVRMLLRARDCYAAYMERGKDQDDLDHKRVALVLAKVKTDLGPRDLATKPANRKR